MTLGAVPIIDIAPFLAGAPGDKRRVAAEVDRACEELGFLIVRGHGVPPDLVAHLRRRQAVDTELIAVDGMPCLSAHIIATAADPVLTMATPKGLGRIACGLWFGGAFDRNGRALTQPRGTVSVTY